MKEYVICSYYLYDNDLIKDYIILSNNKYSHNDSPFFYGTPLDDIFCLANNFITNKPDIKYPRDDNEFREMSIKIMDKACNLTNKIGKECILVKNDGFLKLNKIGGTHMPNYNAYEVIWDEGKSGINPFLYDQFIIWNIGCTSVSNFRIKEFECNRDFIVRDEKINKILE